MLSSRQTRRHTEQAGAEGDITLISCSSATPGVNPDPSPAHRALRRGMDKLERDSNSPAGFGEILVNSLGVFFLYLQPLLLSLSHSFSPSTCSVCFLLFFSLPVTVSLLVIYSGQSVPPLSPSTREDEEEWCCFIMLFLRNV